MTRPSDRWSGLSDLNPESDKFKILKRLLSTANFEYLKMQAIKARRKRESDEASDVTCSIELIHFASGRYNVVFEIAFSDGVYWVARVLYRISDSDTLQEQRTSALSEIATMKIVRDRTTIPLPQVFDFELTAEQPFAYPYVFMECMTGFGLGRGIVPSVPSQYRGKVAKQLANILTQLQGLTFPHIGRLWCGESNDEPVSIIPMAWHHSAGPLDTSLQYFYNQQQGTNREISKRWPDDQDRRTAGWVLMNAVTHIIIPDRVCGPFPLCHMDLHYGNLTFDDEYNITGVLDWSNAQAVPLEQMACCPEVTTFPGKSEEGNRPHVDFRNLFIHSLKESEDELLPDQHRTPLSTFMASSSADLTWRCFMTGPHSAHITAKLSVSKVIYGEVISWEQLKEVYGDMPLS